MEEQAGYVLTSLRSELLRLTPGTDGNECERFTATTQKMSPGELKAMRLLTRSFCVCVNNKAHSKHVSVVALVNRLLTCSQVAVGDLVFRLVSCEEE